MSEIKHGTITGYYASHCRCVDCKEAARLYYHHVKNTEPPKPCQVAGCPKDAAVRNRYCHAHKGRLRRTGSLGGPETRTMNTADVGCAAAHRRVLRARGKAKDHACAVCSGPAKDWAFIHGSPGERPAGLGPDGRYHGPYSINIDDYQPMCAKCHKDYDLERLGVPGSRCPTCGHRNISA